ncbi:MAG: (Fe-S)-binding protein, partial [Bacillota bacterium]|nr:(Fe-S)-binding protein [Bacillota bacterium]
MSAPKPQELLKISHRPPRTGWMGTPVEFRKGTWCYPGKPKSLEVLDLPFPRQWSPEDEDWKLPPNWKEIVLEGLRE